MIKYNRYKNVRIHMDTGVVERLQVIKGRKRLFGLFQEKTKVWHQVDYVRTFSTKDPRPCPAELRAHIVKYTW